MEAGKTRGTRGTRAMIEKTRETEVTGAKARQKGQTLSSLVEALAVVLGIVLVGVGTAAVSSGQAEPRPHLDAVHPAGAR
jgi:hypothetical protein